MRLRGIPGVRRSIPGALLALADILLALLGQTYQTGADTWELFAWWAVLLLPWALAAASQAVWLLWALVTNAALVMWLGGKHGHAQQPLAWSFPLSVQGMVWLASGKVVILELAPVDPRSLMQGDYMALNFAAGREVKRYEVAKFGELHVAENGEALLVRMLGEDLQPL